jgi:hypothetical protein
MSTRVCNVDTSSARIAAIEAAPRGAAEFREFRKGL